MEAPRHNHHHVSSPPDRYDTAGICDRWGLSRSLATPRIVDSCANSTRQKQEDRLFVPNSQRPTVYFSQPIHKQTTREARNE